MLLSEVYYAPPLFQTVIMRVLIVGLFILILLLQYRLWVGEGSVSEVSRLRQAVTEHEANNVRLQMRNNALEAEVHDLKKGMGAIEERARSELGMIREGETFYQIIDADPSASMKASQ